LKNDVFFNRIHVRSDRQALQVTFRTFRTQLRHDLLTWPGCGLNVGKFLDSEDFMGKSMNIIS
jgi:hypothetical protein